MDDLISRHDVIDAIWNTEQHDAKSTVAYNKRLKQLVKIINAVAKLPSAQPEIVRCKECKHYGDDHFCCYSWCTTPEEFCSRGERRE